MGAKGILMATKLHPLTALSARAELATRARKAFRENLMLALDTLRRKSVV